MQAMGEADVTESEDPREVTDPEEQDLSPVEQDRKEIARPNAGRATQASTPIHAYECSEAFPRESPMHT